MVFVKVTRGIQTKMTRTKDVFFIPFPKPRMKKYKMIGSILPLSFKTMATQIVKIIGFLVNYQEPLVK
jgi:hypothetical protein